MTDPNKIETYSKIANTWADHFKVTGVERERLINAYIRRCQQQRFWCTQPTDSYPGTILCRLGGVLIYFDGRLLHTFKIEQATQGRERVLSQPLIPNPPCSSYTKTLIKRVKTHVNRSPAPAMAAFDALTTFSRGFREMLHQELDIDLGRVVRLNLDIETRSMRFIRPRMKFYNGTGAARLKELCAHLDPDILHTIRSVRCPSMSLYNWIASGNKTRRIQAIKAYPLLMPLLILSAEKLYLDGYEEPKEKRGKNDCTLDDLICQYKIEPRLSSREAERIGKQVDTGAKLQPIIAKAFCLPEATIKQIAKHSVYHLGSSLRHIGHEGWSRDLATYADATLLGNRKPVGKIAWTNWMAFRRAFPAHLRRLVTPEQWPSFFAGMPPLDDPRWEEISRRTKDLFDLGLQSQPLGSIGSWPLSRMLNLSERWHEERNAFIREMQQEDERNANDQDPTWSAMLTEPFSADGLEIIELSTPEQLCQEAQRMAHCVDGYSTYCYDGDCRILSIRTEGRSLATMELRLRPFKKAPGVSHLFCAQLRGYNNYGFSLTDPVYKAVEKLLRQVRSRSVQVNLIWPVVPLHQRPIRMRRRDERIAMHMNEWLSAALGDKKALAQQWASAA